MELTRGLKLGTSNRHGGILMMNLTKCAEAYRCCLLQEVAFNRVFSGFNALLHFLCITATIFSVYTAIRSSGLLAAFGVYGAFMALTFYLTMANCYAETNHGSRILLESLQRVCIRGSEGMAFRRDEEIARKRIRSLRELRIRAAFVCYYDKQLILTILQIVLVRSVDLLVMH